MRKRVDQLGVAQPEIQRSGDNEIDVALPDVSNAQRAQDEVGKTAQLYFYDWEPNVIGANGKPAPTEGTVTGDATSRGPAELTAGLLEYEAVLRAAKRPAILRSTDTTWSAGCTAQQVGRLHLRQLVPARHRARKGAVRGPPRNTPNSNLYADNYKPPPGSKPKAVRVNPGTVLVQSRPVESDRRQGHQRIAQQLVRAQRRPRADRRRTSPTRSRASTKAAAAPASRTSPSASPPTARTSSNGSPRKSPTAARKPSCRGSPRKRPCSTSRSCSTAS